MRIYLIRHGETRLNAERILQTPGTPLSDRGRDQAARLARHLEGHGIVRILSSDLARAVETARPLEATTGAACEFEPLLQERNFGDLRGVAYDDLETDPFAPGYEPPGGESEAAFHERVTKAWARCIEVAHGAGGALAVVTHGLVCRAVVSHHVKREPGAEAIDSPLRFRNTSFSVIEGPAPFRLTLLGCDDHLETSDNARGPA
jgi:probable phosphoglycerate mutase